MPEVIPPIIAPHFQHRSSSPSLTLVTCTLSTPAHWLLLRYLHAALQEDTESGKSATTPLSESGSRPQVIFVSLLRSRDLWLELSRKIGLDLPSLAKNKQFVYIDGLAAAGVDISSLLPAMRLKSLALEDLSNAVGQALQACKAEATSADGQRHNPTIVIDGLDFLLASQPDSHTVRLQQFLSQIATSALSVIISCHADSPLLHQHHETATPLEREHAALITTIAHQARLVLQLRGLSTGAAREVTGVLRICKGGNEDEYLVDTARQEGEWLYQCKGDGSVRVWSRGG